MVGVSYELFWHLTPVKLKPFQIAYKHKRQVQDEQMWYMGQYIMSALDATVCNNSIWKGKHSKASKYIEKPILADIDSSNNKEQLTEKEKKEQTNNLFMQLQIMQSNFNLTHQGSS